MLLGKFMERDTIKVYNVLLRGNKKTLADDTHEKKMGELRIC